jgi:TPP-dependent pyruvate/acetoin dehydrogenase alpha subunit
MTRIRLFEETIAIEKNNGTILGQVHTCIGQEAVSVGVCLALNKDDFIIGNHRSHGYMLAKGININSMMAEIYGKSTGTNGGKGGSMHVTDKNIGSLGASGIVGSGIPIACGSGFASKYKNDNKITCVFFGDGAAHEGTFHESLNLAAVWKLPIVFVIENNGLAITTALKQTSLSEDFYQRAQAYNMPGYKVNGQDVQEVYDIMQSIVKYIREGNGPVLLEAKTIRFREHQEGSYYKRMESANYRDNDKNKHDIKNNDPINIYSNKLISEKLINKANLKEIMEEEKLKIDDAVEFAKESTFPHKDEVYKNIFAEEI